MDILSWLPIIIDILDSATYSLETCSLCQQSFKWQHYLLCIYRTLTFEFVTQTRVCTFVRRYGTILLRKRHFLLDKAQQTSISMWDHSHWAIPIIVPYLKRTGQDTGCQITGHAVWPVQCSQVKTYLFQSLMFYQQIPEPVLSDTWAGGHHTRVSAKQH